MTVQGDFLNCVCQTFLILPLYLVSAGGVLFLDGHTIYQFYQVHTVVCVQLLIYTAVAVFSSYITVWRLYTLTAAVTIIKVTV